MAMNNGGGISVPGDPGVLGANQPVSIPGLNSNLQGEDRLIQSNWTIKRGPGQLPLAGTAKTLGKSVQG
jgi:hypothetical protein